MKIPFSHFFIQRILRTGTYVRSIDERNVDHTYVRYVHSLILRFGSIVRYGTGTGTDTDTCICIFDHMLAYEFPPIVVP